MPASPGLTPGRSLAVKRSAPSDGFQASPVPSKLRNIRGIPRQPPGDSGSLAVTAGSTIARRTRRGSRFASVMTASGAFEDDGSFMYERHGSVGLGSDYGARPQVPKHGLRRGTVLAKDQVYKVTATGDVPVDVWNLMQSFGAFCDLSYDRTLMIIHRYQQGCIDHHSLHRPDHRLGCSFHSSRHLRLESRQTHGLCIANLLHLFSQQIISTINAATLGTRPAGSCIRSRKRAGIASGLPWHGPYSMLG